MSWARPVLRRNVDFPPELAPVMMISDFPSACTSLPIAGRRDCSSRHVSRRSVQENAGGDGGAGREGKGVGGARCDPQPLLPPSPGVTGAEHQAGQAVVPVEPRADQHARAEAQLPEVVADLLEVLVVQFALQRSRPSSRNSLVTTGLRSGTNLCARARSKAPTAKTSLELSETSG